MDLRHFILEEDGTVRPVSLMEWAKWFETADRVIAKTEGDDYMVSTVFLGLDHNYEPHGEPLIFESMVFKRGEGRITDWGEQDMLRYTTKAQALKGHAELVEKWLKPDKATGGGW